MYLLLLIMVYIVIKVIKYLFVESPSNQKVENNRYCQNCGTEIAASANFCKSCGNRVSGSNQNAFTNNSEMTSNIKEDGSRPAVLVGNEIHFPPEFKQEQNQAVADQINWINRGM